MKIVVKKMIVYLTLIWANQDRKVLDYILLWLAAQVQIRDV